MDTNMDILWTFFDKKYSTANTSNRAVTRAITP